MKVPFIGMDFYGKLVFVPQKVFPLEGDFPKECSPYRGLTVYSMMAI